MNWNIDTHGVKLHTHCAMSQRLVNFLELMFQTKIIYQLFSLQKTYGFKLIYVTSRLYSAAWSPQTYRSTHGKTGRYNYCWRKEQNEKQKVWILQMEILTRMVLNCINIAPRRNILSIFLCWCSRSKLFTCCYFTFKSRTVLK